MGLSARCLPANCPAALASQGPRFPSGRAGASFRATMPPNTGTRLLSLWRRLRAWPGGEWLFAKLFSRVVPYSGSVRPRIKVLEPGHAEVEIPDIRANRQHLGSVHAIALMNVAEMASGLAMMAGLPDDVRGIVISLAMTYHKKARGTIRAVSRVTVPSVTEDRDFEVVAECFDPAGTLVATGRVHWRLGPTPR